MATADAMQNEQQLQLSISFSVEASLYCSYLGSEDLSYTHEQIWQKK